MRKLEIYLDRRKLTLNIKKSKMMIFRKGKGKNRKATWRWKEEEIEMVKEFTYLWVRLQKNGDLEAHIREIVKRANITIKEK